MKLLFFSQTTCGPCKLMEIIIQKVSNVTGITVTKIDAAKKGSNERVQYNITRTPTIILVDNNGNELTRFNGIQREDILVSKINEYK